MIKALIVDDSGLMRLIISDIISADPQIKVIGTASDGKEAVNKTCELNPDIVILDMEMGRYGGKYAIEQIMEKCPTPILILSSLGNTNLDEVLEALNLGAVDYVNKPDKNKAKIRDISSRIIARVKAVSRSSNKKALLLNKKTQVNTHVHTFNSKLKYDAIVIGASTGGPSAIEKIITKFPSNLPIPVFICQHMPVNFIHSFAQRLNALTPLNVIVGEKDMKVKEGNIYIAPGDHNMIVSKNKVGRIIIDYDAKVYKEYNNPSINSMMLSIANIYNHKAIGVVLTGMGKDGAQGMQLLHEKGAYTIAQDKVSSVIYGMPKEVFEKGYAKESVSIDAMSGFLISCLD